MDIKILDSHLRKYLKTKATPQKIAEKLSLASVSVERVEPLKDDFIYTIEVTTNRPDLASVVGLAREAGAVLPQNGIEAKFLPPKLEKLSPPKDKSLIEITNLDKYVYRVCGVVMDVAVKDSPAYIKESLEAAGIRCLNNLIDITNFVMLTIGHPTHVFDFDRLQTHRLVIREAKKGETVTTLDNKTYELPGGDLVADNGTEIVDLLGIMGLKNSVVTEKTKRILFFIDNNDPLKMRKTSMTLGIRTEAAQLNEKEIDPFLAEDAMLFGAELYQKLADAKILQVIDIFPNPPKPDTVHVTEEKIDQVIGVSVPIKTAISILTDLGFTVREEKNGLTVTPPHWRERDIHIPEDIIEEIARVYGYENIPNLLPPLSGVKPVQYGKTDLFWEARVKDMMKYLGFTETYTYSMVSERQYEGPLDESVKISNYLSEDMMYMRKTLAPSLLQVLSENKTREKLRIFEIANIYTKNLPHLPSETRMFVGVIKEPHLSFFSVKGILEQICTDMGIKNYSFTPSKDGGNGASVFIEKEYVGDIEVLDSNVINFELHFEIMCKYATLKKIYTPASKFPPIIEDFAFVIDAKYSTETVISEIKKQSSIIHDVSLLDRYQNTRTFHIIYQDSKKNLTKEIASEVREKIINAVEKSFKGKIKE